MLLRYFPWVAKGTEYLRLPRGQKADILDEKIMADLSVGAATPFSEFMKIDPNATFDEMGDEFDCRLKTAHQHGSVARIEWESTGDHAYTGLFRGADTGFIRLSAAVLVITPDEAADNPGKPSLVPSIAVKLLRDGVDSGNTVGNAIPLYENYHFFENDIVTNILSLDEIYDENSLLRGRDASRFFGSVGHSNLASHDQDGEIEENP